MEDIDKEISEMKLTVNARARIVALSFLSEVCRSRCCTHANVLILFFAHPTVQLKSPECHCCLIDYHFFRVEK